MIKNCMEHTPEGGEISIAARETPIYSEIIISDSGEGISPRDLPHIFERFYKGENSSHQSFGIGLALARMIITGQNGTVKAENSPEGGAVFTVRFYKTTV
jgi:signal transduction histidine kinase